MPIQFRWWTRSLTSCSVRWPSLKSIFVATFIRSGHYEFLMMPFGLCNALTTFQNTMNIVFKHQLGKFLLVFFDDILVFSLDFQLHMHHLWLVLATLHQNFLVTKASKCDFALSSIHYLGYIISTQGVVIDPDKISAIFDWPCPTLVKQLPGFLGLSEYYRHFVQHYAHIAAPLTALLCKDSFKWYWRLISPSHISR